MDAKAELQTWLDTMGAATLAGDWPTYSEHVSLPFRLTTETGDMTVHTEAELKRGFDGFVASLRAQSVSDYVRIVLSADSPAPDRLSGTYSSHILSQGLRVLPRFDSAIELAHQDGIWRATTIANTLNNDRWPIDVPGVTQRL